MWGDVCRRKTNQRSPILGPGGGEVEKPYFHELDVIQMEWLLSYKKPWNWLIKNYQQPSWCNYHEALGGVMGCWSLVTKRIHGIKDCGDCDMIRKMQ